MKINAFRTIPDKLWLHNMLTGEVLSLPIGIQDTRVTQEVW